MRSAFCFGKMRISIRLADPGMAMKLAKRFAELAPGIETDTVNEDGGEYDFVITEDNLEAIFPVSEALNRMEGQYFKRTGKRLQRANKGPKGLFIFTSGTGGSGLTAVSLTFARIMAGKLNGRVLYISGDGYGQTDYLECVKVPERQSMELMYLLRTGADPVVGAYLSKDRYGPLAISLKDPDRETLLGIIEGSGCEYAVISGRKVPIDGNARIEVINAMDRRRPAPDPDADVTVYNRGQTIPRDEDSFTWDGQDVKISMSGDFALQVGKLFREGVDEYGYGRTWQSGA